MPTPEKHRSKSKFGARLSDIDIHALKQYARDHDLKTHTQTLSAIIAENSRLHMYVQYLGDIRQVGKEAPCDLRILFQGEFYCGNKPPKATKLLTLDICKVCQKIRWHIKDTETEEPSKPEMTLEQGRETIKDPQVKHSGMIYCGDGGQWVFPQKCKSCRLPLKCRNFHAYVNEST